MCRAHTRSGGRQRHRGSRRLGALLAGWIAAASRGVFFPSRLSDPAALRQGIGHHRHQGVAVEPGTISCTSAGQAFRCRRDTDKRPTAPRALRLRSGQPTAGIGQHSAEADPRPPDLINLLNRNLEARAILTQGRALVHSRSIARAAFRQDQPQAQYDRKFA